MDYNPDKVFIKSTYAANLAEMGIEKSDQVDVIGCDSDACVMATAFALFDGGYNFRILADYVYSSGGPNMDNYAKEIMRRNFGKALTYR